MTWFRMYHAVLGDPKVHRLTIVRRWRWVEVLCIASAAKQRGKLPSIADMAFHMRIKECEAESIIADLIRVGLVDQLTDDKGLSVHDWDEHQKPSDGSADRVRAHRDRSRNVTSNGPVTLHETLPSRDSNVLDSDTDTEREENTPLKPPRGGTRCSSFAPPDWVPRQDWDDFIDMRKRSRKNPTDKAKELLVAKLDRLRSEGHDPGKVLQRSIERNWQSVFPLEDDTRPRPKVDGYHKPDPGAPKDTTAPIRRPDLPRTPEFASVHAMWDRTEANLRKDRELKEADERRARER